MVTLRHSAVNAFRVRRQMLAPETRGVGRDGLLTATRVCQPAYPGTRWLMARTPEPFDAGLWASLWEEGAIVRGRFVKGNLEFVRREDLHLYLDAFSKHRADELGPIPRRLLSFIERNHPATTDQLASELGSGTAKVRAGISCLSARGLVSEQPRDTWSPTEPGETDASTFTGRQFDARIEVVSRFMANHGPASVQEISDRFAWPVSQVRQIVGAMADGGTLIRCDLDDDPEPRFVRAADVDAIESTPPVEPFVTILDCWDQVARAQKTELERRFGWGSSIPAYWHYILVNGEWMGAFRVHYKTKILWVREMKLTEDIIADEQLTSDVFAEVTRLGPLPIRIEEMNGEPVRSSINRRILESLGYDVGVDAAVFPST